MEQLVVSGWVAVRSALVLLEGRSDRGRETLPRAPLKVGEQLLEWQAVAELEGMHLVELRARGEPEQRLSELVH